MQKKLITNERLRKETEAKMYLEIGCLNLLKERIHAPFTKENLFKFKENPRWELEDDLSQLDLELTGHLRLLKSQAKEAIMTRYDEDYFDQIDRCFEDCPIGLQPSDIEIKGGVLSYAETYRTTRLATASLELSEQETEVFNALLAARQAVAKLKSVLGSGMWSGELEYLISSKKDISEVGFEHFSQQRIRKSRNN